MDEANKSRKKKDYTGKIFNNLTALYYVGKNKSNQTIWKFKCSCGNETEKSIGNVAAGTTKSCGCMRGMAMAENIKFSSFIDNKTGIACRVEDIRDVQFNHLTAMEFLHMNKHGKSVWKYTCACGKVLSADSNTVKRGHRKSCGCERRHDNNVNHGLTKSDTSEIKDYYILRKIYDTWHSMKTRCKDNDNINYGERGITYCDEWENFDNFLKDMGKPPDNSYSIERIAVNGNYEPNNCKWATNIEQARNKRNNIFIDYNGEKLCLTELVQKYSSIKRATVDWRIKHGWTVQRALTELPK